MEKIQITEEQATAINHIENGVKDSIVGTYFYNKGFITDRYRSLNKLSAFNLMRCLFVPGSYEVITDEFFEGDWVVTKSGYVGQIEFINVEESWANIGYSKDTKLRGVCLAKTFDLDELERYASPEEIQQAKKRRFWDRIGRKEDEYRHDDLVITDAGDYGFIDMSEEDMCTGNNYPVVFLKDDSTFCLYRSDIRLVVTPENRLDK